VVSGYAVHAYVQGQQEVPKSIVSLGRIVLDQVPGNDGAICLPVASLVVVNNRLQGRLRGGAAQAAFGIGEKMRIREMQNPYQIFVG